MVTDVDVTGQGMGEVRARETSDLDLPTEFDSVAIFPPDLIMVSFEQRVECEYDIMRQNEKSRRFLGPDAVHAFIHLFIHRPKFLRLVREHLR
jgi:hypothetical protein